MSLLFNMMSRLVVPFLPRSKCLLIPWLQSPSAVILKLPPKTKSDTVSTSIWHEAIGPDAMIFVFWMLSFKTNFHSLLSLSSRGFLVPLHFLPLEKEMATYSSVLAWRIPGTREPGGLPSMGSHRVRHDWSNLAATAAASVYLKLLIFLPAILVPACASSPVFLMMYSA